MKKNKEQSTTKNRMATYAGICLVLVLVSLLATVVLAVKYDRLQKDYNLLKNGNSTKIWQPNQEVLTNHFMLKVNKVLIDEVGVPEHLPAPEGTKFVTVDLSVKNMTDSDKLFIVHDHMYVRDESGYRYDSAVAPNVTVGIAGTIAAGDTAAGQVGFLVPKTTTDLKLYFEPYGEDTAQTVIIDIN